MAVNRMERDKQILLLPHPPQGKKFNIKLQYVLKPDQKRSYYNKVLKTFVDQIESTPNLVKPYTIINCLKNNLELEYCN